MSNTNMIIKTDFKVLMDQITYYCFNMFEDYGIKWILFKISYS